MRCRNWKGSAKISYEDIITIESNFASTGDVFPSISTSGNFKDVITDAEFVRVFEMKDERVDLIIDMQRNKYDWSKHVWAYKETVKPFQYSSEEDGSDEEAAVETSETEIEEEIESTRVSPTKKRKNRFRDTGPSDFTTPMTSFRPQIFKTPFLIDSDDIEVPMLSFYRVLQIGPSTFDAELASRIIGPNIWLKNFDMDAMMYLFREKTTLRRWSPDRVAFLNCMFSNQIITAYGKLDGNRRGYKIDDNFLEYGRGELPYHGSTGSVWSVDVDRLYIPICVNQIHWISICVNLVNRTIDVFDCGGKKNNRVIEAFAVLIPRIVKAVQSPERKKDFNVKQYTVSYVPMRGLNMSGNDCGAYSLKFIECHLLGLDFSLVNDENIKEARHKIAFDLWEAANDAVLQSRMSTFKPPKRAPVKPVDLG
ncbi:unnamed protein product [Brassica oleracea]